MSVFFSFGAVLASIIGYLVLPKWSCPEEAIEPCDMRTQNNGWRIMLFTVSMATFIMLALRTLWLKLPETPKFLMSQDRHNETIIVLQDIAKINGGHVHIDKDELPNMRHKYRQTALDEEEEEGESYDMIESLEGSLNEENDEVNHVLLSNGQHTEEIMVKEKEKTKVFKLLMSSQWRLTTLLIWSIWTFTSVAYTMFNVFLPKFLETLGFEGEAVPTRQQVYWDYMIYSLAGVPGSVVRKIELYNTSLLIS
jgi:hypothetical protein